MSGDFLQAGYDAYERSVERRSARRASAIYAADPIESSSVPISAWVPFALRQRLRATATERGTTMTQIIADAVAVALEEAHDA